MFDTYIGCPSNPVGQRPLPFGCLRTGNNLNTYDGNVGVCDNLSNMGPGLMRIISFASDKEFDSIVKRFNKTPIRK